MNIFYKNKLRGFTLIEILICIALCTMIGTASIIFMTRGSSNVARGSFNTLAANQAALLAYYLRADMMSHPYYAVEDGKISLKSKDGSEITYTRIGRTVIRKDDSHTLKLATDMAVEFGPMQGRPPDFYDNIESNGGHQRLKTFYFGLTLNEKESSEHFFKWYTVINIPVVEEKDTSLSKIWNSIENNQNVMPNSNTE